MRVSTHQIYNAGTLGIQGNQQALYKTQNQLSTGRRMLTPEDDPVASAQALIVTQSKAVNEQYIENQGAAKTQLAAVDSHLQSISALLQNVRERVVQAGNTVLQPPDRLAIATEIDARLGELIGIANSQDGTGQYLFSGYRGLTLPFAAGPAGDIQYFGDDGRRSLQVSDSRELPISLPGSDLFMRPFTGNGTFTTSVGGNQATLGAVAGTNQGTGVVDAGSVLNPSLWNNAANPGNFMIRFTVAAGVTSYTLYDSTAPAAPVALTAALPYTPGQVIPLQKTLPPPVDFGAQMTITGQPADGDTFTVARSTSQSTFQTLQNISSILRGFTTTTEFVNRLGAELTNIDRSFDNLGKMTAEVGSYLRELDSLGDASADVGLQYSSRLSDLQDLDYNEAISNYTKQQLQLEAAQKSFTQIARLSLFDLL